MKEQPPAKNDAVSPNRVLKAVLKTPHSKRWRDCRKSPNLAKRLERVRL